MFLKFCILGSAMDQLFPGSLRKKQAQPSGHKLVADTYSPATALLDDNFLNIQMDIPNFSKFTEGKEVEKSMADIAAVHTPAAEQVRSKFTKKQNFIKIQCQEFNLLSKVPILIDIMQSNYVFLFYFNILIFFRRACVSKETRFMKKLKANKLMKLLKSSNKLRTLKMMTTMMMCHSSKLFHWLKRSRYLIPLSKKATMKKLLMKTRKKKVWISTNKFYQSEIDFQHLHSKSSICFCYLYAVKLHLFFWKW